MTRHTPSRQAIENISRRGFVAGLGGGLVLAVGLSGVAVADEAGPPKYGADGQDGGWRDDPRLFVAIDPQGHVAIICHRSEMGQGIRTSLAMVLADELGADFARVRVDQANGDEARYGNQDTDGSRSMRHFFGPMRRAGAAARTMLETAAAAKWGVPASEVSARDHQLTHGPSGRKIGFGAVATAAAALPVPARDALRLKAPDAFRYIGKDVVSGVDLFDMTTGGAFYGIDARPAGVVHAVVARPPVMGGTLASYDATETLKVPGVLKVVTIRAPKEGPPLQPLGGVAVVARNTWAAIQGRKALKLSWNDGPHGAYDSVAYRAVMEAAARAPGDIVHQAGDVDAALAGAAKRVTAAYYLPHLAHASMEPPSATARIDEKGRCEVWACVQAPQGARDLVAFVLGARSEDVTVHVSLLGGGFGRKSMPDFVAEAALVSKAMGGAPVKLTWTREDDLHHDFFHTVSVERLEGGLDGAGKVTAWRHRSVAPTIDALFGPDTRHESGDELGMGMVNLPFDIPSVRLENPAAEAHTRIGWFRSVSNVPHAFAVQSFAAELAAAAGRDQRDFLLELIGPDRRIDPRTLDDKSNYGESPERYPLDTGRLKGVIAKATQEIGWGRPLARGGGLGVAGHYSFVTYTACAMEVFVDAEGTLHVPRVDVAIDCGAIVNPDRVRAQAEGSVIMGLTLALMGEITFKDGRVQQNNFDGFPVLRMKAAPKAIHVHFAPSDFGAPMGGVGEPCLPPVAPALVNAIFAATGKRIRALPIRDQLRA